MIAVVVIVCAGWLVALGLCSAAADADRGQS